VVLSTQVGTTGSPSAVREKLRSTTTTGLQTGAVNEADMLIKNLFERDIFRPINGVVEGRSGLTILVWQELA